MFINCCIKDNKAVGVMRAGNSFTIEPMISQGTWRDEHWVIWIRFETRSVYFGSVPDLIITCLNYFSCSRTTGRLWRQTASARRNSSRLSWWPKPAARYSPRAGRTTASPGSWTHSYETESFFFWKSLTLLFCS